MKLFEFVPEVDFWFLLAVPLIPLLGYAVQIFAGKRLPWRGDVMLTGGMFVVMLITVWMGSRPSTRDTRASPSSTTPSRRG